MPSLPDPLAPDAPARLLHRQRPVGWPIMRQRWGKLLFMHWPLAPELVAPLLPPGLTLDTFGGQAWVGLVPFTMWGVRASFLPPVPGTSAFHELNVRTYVLRDGVPGVWFFSLDAAYLPAVWGARLVYHLPYYHAAMQLRQEGSRIHYESRRRHRGAPPATLTMDWEIGDPLPPAELGSLDFFLTERYLLYAARGEWLYHARIWHPPWPLRRATVAGWQSTMVAAAGMPEPTAPPLLHYAEEVPVDIWPIYRLK